MDSPAELDCKKILVRRCLSAVVLSIGMQYLLLTAFLLFVNFSIFHPITWITRTLGLIFSLYTWIFIMPLISGIVLYGFYLGNSYLSVKRYYPTRFSWICGTALRKLTAIVNHGLVGFLTAWLYSRFLNEEYRHLFKDCFDGYCINDRCLFLAFAGLYSGTYFFIRERLTKEISVEFPVIQGSKYVAIRSHLYNILYSSLLESFIPTLCYVVLYWLTGWVISNKLSSIFGAEIDESFRSFYSIISSFRLILYVWIPSSQILSNMYLMDVLFSTFLTEKQEFVIEKQVDSDVTLVEALSLSKVPVAEHLACLDLFNIANPTEIARRQQIFALSIPGGHAYNWNQLSGQCLSMINAFNEELSESIKSISIIHNISRHTSNGLKPTATESAEKILLRQYNENFGIRNMTMNTPSSETNMRKVDLLQATNDAVDKIRKSFNNACTKGFYNIPGLCYLFGELEGAKTSFFLSKSQDIIWLTQGLAGLCASSINEDKYGVVQSNLPDIIKSFLKLKLELDKINNITLNGKKLDKNGIALKNAIKRSLYRICSVFGDYIKDIIDDQDDLRNLKYFVDYLEA